MAITMDPLGAAVSVGQMGMQNKWNKRQMEQEEKLTEKQYQNQRNLNEQGSKLQMDMWNNTNYGAQMKHMKEAGLNPALMYGMSGGGGATTGSQGGGSASKGNAPQAPKVDMSSMMMGAQIELMKAQGAKANAEADKLKGVDTELARESTNLQLENVIGKQLANEITRETKDYQKMEIRNRAVGVAIQNAERKSKTALNEEQKKIIREKVNQGWAKLGIETLMEVPKMVFGAKNGGFKEVIDNITKAWK